MSKVKCNTNKLTSANIFYVNMTIRRALGAIPACRVRSAFALSCLTVTIVAQTSGQVAIARNAFAIRKTRRAIITVGAMLAFSTNVTCGKLKVNVHKKIMINGYEKVNVEF